MTGSVSWPRWMDRSTWVNLREVAPGLLVGACRSAARVVELGLPLSGVVDLYGITPPDISTRYGNVRVRHLPMLDGDVFPPGTLDVAADELARARTCGGYLLVHCQAGLSRSAAAAYALLRRVDEVPDLEALARVSAGDPRYPRRLTLGSAELWAQQGRAAGAWLAGAGPDIIRP